MPWSSFRGNPLNTALARNRLTKTVQSWIFQPDLPDTIGFYGSPSIDADGTVYIGSGSVYALDGATGKLIWTFPTDDYIKSSPAIARNGVLYIGCGSGVVYALNTAIGTLKWQFRTGGRVQASPAIGPDGSVYIGAYDGTLYALDGETGAKK